MPVLYCPSEQGYNRWSVMGNYANVSQSPGVDGPWQGANGAALARGRHSCNFRPQTHVDSVSLALRTLVKVRQHDTQERKRGRERESAPL